MNSQNHLIGNERVTVILCCYNGGDYLIDQLQSISTQSHRGCEVHLFDDSSPIPFDLDKIGEMGLSANVSSVTVRSKNVGFATNFMHALRSLPDDSDYYAFCDQDDIWHSRKIETAISNICSFPDHEATLYCARTEIVDHTGEKTLAFSPEFKRTPSFANAIVQSIAGGNTMVFNKSAKKILKESWKDQNIVSHDWWCYQIISGVGGNVIYDAKPCLKYRQHGKNLIGTNTGIIARIERLKMLLDGQFRDWNDRNAISMKLVADLFTEKNIEILDYFIKARRSSLLKRLYYFHRAGVYRQSFLGNVGLLVGILLNKV